MAASISFFASPPAALLVSIIDLYQRYISPRKGFRCAYRAARGRPSCSEFGKRALCRGGILAFWPLLRRRFARCAAAARMLKAGRRAAAAPHPPGQSRDDRRHHIAETCDCAPDLCMELPSCDVGDCGADPGAGAACSVADACSTAACDIDFCSVIG